MKNTRFTAERIAFALRQAEGGVPVREVCRNMGASKQTLCRRKKKFDGMGAAEVRRLKHLDDETRKLKQLVADLSLDRQILEDATRGSLGRLIVRGPSSIGGSEVAKGGVEPPT